MPFAARAAQCWLTSLTMDPSTGLDRSDLQLRAMPGFSGIDFFVPGYVVWAGVMQTLADLGAGTLVDMHPAPYDWVRCCTETRLVAIREHVLKHNL